MAPPGLREPRSARVTLGPHKLILDHASLPAASELAATIADTHHAGSPVAFHCVTAGQLLIAIAALEQAGTAGDRIEHAGIVLRGQSVDLEHKGSVADVGEHRPGYQP
jgi:predicted amidohydrolase YtcJ